MDIQEKKELLKLLSDYHDETILKAWSLKTLIDNPYARKSNEIERVVYYLYLDIIGSNLQRRENEKKNTVCVRDLRN